MTAQPQWTNDLFICKKQKYDTVVCFWSDYKLLEKKYEELKEKVKEIENIHYACNTERVWEIQTRLSNLLRKINESKKGE